ncbi:hypothetical protein GCM10010406_43030 [Streptomyces thermolineatus]|uniref:BACON domain-containing protein n=1 Tax=Streptomyces thermolineatus TaxID=44033 RepID=A0ABP5ZP40_9ACTN
MSRPESQTNSTGTRRAEARRHRMPPGGRPCPPPPPTHGQEGTALPPAHGQEGSALPPVRGRAGTTVRRRAPGGPTLPQQPPAHYDRYLDGLFTYCLSVLCDHDAATAALGDALALAERHQARLRNLELRRPWLYALARYACLGRLSGAAETGGRALPGSRTEDGRDAHGAARDAADAAAARSIARIEAQRRTELASLAWPEAAGTVPEQREALELAVRHQLPVHEIAAVLGIETDAAGVLLSRAACEVERTRTALAVVGIGRCPAVANLAGDRRLLLGTALRRELVRHVDECADCRLTAEHAVAAGPWPGTVTPAVLGLVRAPRAETHVAMVRAARAWRDNRSFPASPAPRFDRRGFPLEFKDRAARRAALRSRAVTTTVVAAVVAAPVLALWAAYRSGGHEIERQNTTPVSATERDTTGDDGPGGPGGPPAGPGGFLRAPGAPGTADGRRPSGDRVHGGATATASPSAPPSDGPAGDTRARETPAAGRLDVTAGTDGTSTVITLTASGTAPVHWTAGAADAWIRLSSRSGVLRPGESAEITVTVDRDREPAGEWSSRVLIGPSGTAVTVVGRGADPQPAPEPEPDPEPEPTGSQPAPGTSEPASAPREASSPPASPDRSASSDPSGSSAP